RHEPIQFGFWLAGEPVLHPEIVELVSIASSYGIKPAMHSNATKMTRPLAEGLIKAGLHWLSFSFDGDNKEDYERLRTPAKYEDTIEKIRMFLRVREELGSKTPHVVIQNVVEYRGPEVHPRGAPVMADANFRRQFDGTGVNEFKAILAHSWSGQLDGYGGVAPNIKDTGQRWICIIPFRDMTISYNGDIVSCCGDLDGTNVIDNVVGKDFYEVWNGKGFQKFRNAMLTDEIERWPLCGDCERIWTTDPHPNDFPLKYEMLRYKLRF
ncbi:MAG: SPASM domain-containing protein, partial [Candidatus Sumerlaeaceae bacterium]|nr:SPASM domain-containing protein [Candidatus Sumerlaeaceae bacterium]